MLILDKRRALERIVSLVERLHEAVPEPYSLRASTFMTMPPPGAVSGSLLPRPDIAWRERTVRKAPLLIGPLR